MWNVVSKIKFDLIIMLEIKCLVHVDFIRNWWTFFLWFWLKQSKLFIFVYTAKTLNINSDERIIPNTDMYMNIVKMWFCSCSCRRWTGWFSTWQKRFVIFFNEHFVHGKHIGVGKWLIVLLIFFLLSWICIQVFPSLPICCTYY